MHSSTLTEKGQTTIPLEIREYLHLTPHDKIIYVPDDNRVYLAFVKGTILGLKGSLNRKAKKTINFKQLREFVKDKVVKEIIEKK